MRAVLFKSVERFDAFKKQLEEHNIETIILDFNYPQWLDFDYKTVDLLIYYPSFQYSSDHPLALWHVYDNLKNISLNNPHLLCYPDPQLLVYYNDKYRQYLFLKENNLPIPLTMPLLSANSVNIAERMFGYPLIIKNRFGAGGGSVFMVENKKQLIKYFKLSTLDLFNSGAFLYYLKMFSKRMFYYFLIKEKQMPYIFLSPPLLAQQFVEHDRDLKLVLNNVEVVEGHWRAKADKNMWKVNIDGGGIGEWSYIPDEAIKLGQSLAKKLNSHWLNIDLFATKEGFLISEFSPVWHHYAYKEKPNFIYKNDYNIKMNLEDSLNLEKIIIESLLKKISNS